MNHISLNKRNRSQQMRKREGNKEEKIIAAAVKVFARNGFHDAKISHIADQAGVAHGSVYLYFKNKQAILLRILKDLWQKLAGQVETLASQTELTPKQKIESMLDMVFDVFTSNPALSKVVISEQSRLMDKDNQEVFRDYYRQFSDVSQAIFSEGVEQGVIHPEMNPEIFLQFFYGGLRYLIHVWASGQTERSIDEMRQNVKYMLQNGIFK